MPGPKQSRAAIVLAATLVVGGASASDAQTQVPEIGPLRPVEANPDNAPTEARLALGRAGGVVPCHREVKR
jgi:hypothetical protein